jgi:hypothetical protein
MPKELTTRQWDLYNFLKNNYDEEIYIPKSEIVKYVFGYQVKEDETRFCRDIEFDVRAINENETIQKIIVSSSKGYKIGTPQQVHDYLWSRENEAKRSLVLTYKLRHKAELNGQFRLQFGKSERNVIESYLIKEMKEEQVNDN